MLRLQKWGNFPNWPSSAEFGRRNKVGAYLRYLMNIGRKRRNFAIPAKATWPATAHLLPQRELPETVLRSVGAGDSAQ